MRPGTPSPSPGADAALALDALAVEPGLGGLQVSGLGGPGRDALVTRAETLFTNGDPLSKVPLNVSPEALLGGLDLALTLRSQSGPVLRRGLLARADGAALLLAMAERQERLTVSSIIAALDTGEVRLERDGFGEQAPARFVLLALDEALDDDESLDPGLADRLAFRVFTDLFDELPPAASARRRAAAKQSLAEISLTSDQMTTLDQTTLVLGIGSLRRSLLAARTARVLAALRGAAEVGDEDIAAAVRLTLLPFAVELPASSEAETPNEPEPPEQSEAQPEDQDAGSEETPDALPEELLIAAAQAVLPPNLLASLARGRLRSRRGASGRNKAFRRGLRGRPIGVRQGAPRPGERLNLLATVRAAAPWQRMRGAKPGRLAVQPGDFRTGQRKQRTQLTTVFVVDASGSAAAQRLAEVKGAVELLLADCYVRRDQVALITFRGQHPELLLPPTRSLARARRALADLPGGGPTPLAGALDAARELAESLQRRGQEPLLVILTDGRGNVSRDGRPGAPESSEQAVEAARELAAAGYRTLLVDASRRPRREAQTLAEALSARYLPLPRADAETLSSAIASAGRVH
ncbi:MAG: magnesium chelatase subunit D [Pseudomonadota bacterium]